MAQNSPKPGLSLWLRAGKAAVGVLPCILALLGFAEAQTHLLWLILMYMKAPLEQSWAGCTDLLCQAEPHWQGVPSCWN